MMEYKYIHMLMLMFRKKNPFRGGEFETGGFNIFPGKISISKGTARGERGKRAKNCPNPLGGGWGNFFALFPLSRTAVPFEIEIFP